MSGEVPSQALENSDCHEIVIVDTGQCRRVASEVVPPVRICNRLAGFPACELRPSGIRQWRA
jgi:hypothetical protein